MTNHVHLVAIPKHSDSLALALGQTHGKYACWFNRRRGRSGHLWQNRFYSCALGPSHVVTALAYVDLNPVRANLVPKAADYLWSSAQAHLAGAESDPLIDAWAWSELRVAGDWAETLERQAQLSAAELRRATYAGVPFGDEIFVAAMERRHGRSLRRRPPGPKPKAAAAAVAGPGNDIAARCTSRS